MTYVLLYVEEKQPCFIQGTLEEINARLRTLWLNQAVDQEDWEYYQNWALLGLEDGILSPVNVVECNSIPHFEVH